MPLIWLAGHIYVGQPAMTNVALISKLEKAKEGSRAMSDGVLLVLGWTQSKPDHWKIGELAWKIPQGEWAGQPPDPTRDLQDAVDLVPEGWIVADLRQRINPPVWHWYCALSYLTAKFESFDIRPDTEAPTPALALSIAILKALEAGDG